MPKINTTKLLDYIIYLHRNSSLSFIKMTTMIAKCEVTLPNTRPLLCQGILKEFDINPGYPDALDQRILWWSCIQKSNGIRLCGES